MNLRGRTQTSKKPTKATQGNPGKGLFLPNFCAGQTLLPVLLIAELLAFAFATTQTSLTRGLWANLGLVSLFMQWVALASAGVLCAARRYMARQRLKCEIAISYGLLLAVAAVVSEIAYEVAVSGGVAPRIGLQGRAVFIGRNVLVAAVVDALFLRYFYITSQWRRNLERDAQMRIEALQARIRPHFLFNSLNTIAALVRPKPEVAERVIENLADLFRASLGAGGTVVSLADEIHLTRQYEQIELLRLGARLRVDWQVEQAPDDAQVPQLILQPVLENAIYHGIEPHADGGVISIVARCDENVIEIEVHNPVGPETPWRRRGNHMALANVRERLALLYGGCAGVDVSAHETYFQLILRFPYRPMETV